jgi:hypothetical protein
LLRLRGGALPPDESLLVLLSLLLLSLLVSLLLLLVPLLLLLVSELEEPASHGSTTPSGNSGYQYFTPQLARIVHHCKVASQVAP